MLFRVVLGSLILVSMSGLAHDTSGGRNTQCSGVIPGAKPIYFFSSQGDRIVVRSSYSEAAAIGIGSNGGQSVVSAKINIQIFPKSSSSSVAVGLSNQWSAQDCKGAPYSGNRDYQIQLKPCMAGSSIGYEGTIGGNARYKGTADGFVSDSPEAIAIGYLGYCKNGPAFGGSTQKLMIELNGRRVENPVGDKTAFGLTL
ncbi:MAG: hypothetical protein K2X47_17565 [Bdellovibrionales bacterium]|nr:hypothetical protein [Bdellovibrionales bacterium]